jgi:ligand-binding sensor domain-containing protein/PAS domain-containing protein
MAQTPDGYLWLAGQTGLFRFDGVKFTLWQPPAGQSLPNKPYSLLVSRDGALWIGTFGGLVSWNGVELTRYKEIGDGFVTSLLEDRDGTVWAGLIAKQGELCSIRHGRAECFRQDGAFGTHVWSLAEDREGVLWVGAANSGLWRWKPGPPKRFVMPGALGDLITSADGKLLIGIRGEGLKRFVGDKLETYPIRSAVNPTEWVTDAVVNSNKLLRDREGGVWIGTNGIGLHHVKDGKADTFTAAGGLSGDIACSLFEDREGNIWFASEKGLDRFRKLSVATHLMNQGPSSDITKAVLATADGSVWVSASEGLFQWKNGRPRVFGRADGLPDTGSQSLFQDHRGRVWLSTYSGLAYFEREKFVMVEGQPGNESASIVGDDADNLWVAGPWGLGIFKDAHHLETIEWIALGKKRRGIATADRGGVWLGFWIDGDVAFFKDGKIRETYTAADGLGKGDISALRVDRDGALWVSTQAGGLSRIKDGRVHTLTIRNGLPCNAIHWSIEDDKRSLWLYTACGLVRVMRDDVTAWISDPSYKLDTKRWGAADGVPIRAVSPAYSSPAVTKAADGKLWFVAGEGVQVVDPDHLQFNAIPPPVYVEHIIADREPYSVVEGMRLPPLVRDVTIEFTALSLVDSQSVQFRYRLEGHDNEWQEAGDRRQAFYTNLKPGDYRFLVKASNNNGVWNDEGSRLAFSIEPAYYQTYWFRLACAGMALGLVWSGFHLRDRRLRSEEKRLREVIEGIPTMAFSMHPNGMPDLVNPRWMEYTGMSPSATDNRGWESAIHPDDVQVHLRKWRAALLSGGALRERGAPPQRQG